MPFREAYRKVANATQNDAPNGRLTSIIDLYLLKGR